MPPRVKITKDMVVDAAFEVVREMGAENINVRTVAKKLGCSTQPIMYHFATIKELKKTVYAKADCYHSEYLTTIKDTQNGVILGIGLNYIRFAIEERQLFRFLFQSNNFAGRTLVEMIDAEELMPVISTMQGAIGESKEQVKNIFLTVFLFAHGYASMIANNSLKYDEQLIKTHLKRVYRGAILAVQE